MRQGEFLWSSHASERICYTFYWNLKAKTTRKQKHGYSGVLVNCLMPLKFIIIFSTPVSRTKRSNHV
jgi:hypothetical protein